MSEPGLDLHEWQTRWEELDEQLADDPAGALPAAVDLVERILEARELAFDDPVADDGISREVLSAHRSAREIADRVERGEDVDPGDVGQAVAEVRDLFETLTAERPA